MNTALGMMSLLVIVATIGCVPPQVVAGWERSGDWHKNDYEEQGFAEYLRREGVRAESIRMASLDSPTISPRRNLYLTLGCIDDADVIYNLSYTDRLSTGNAEYAFGLNTVGESAPDHTFTQTAQGHLGKTAGDFRISITDDDHIDQVLELLHAAADTPEQFVSLDARRGSRILTANFNPAGIDDALDYLVCFH